MQKITDLCKPFSNNLEIIDEPVVNYYEKDDWTYIGEKEADELEIPLEFWFSRNSGVPLPLLCIVPPLEVSKCSWFEEIGHHLIESISIGDQSIDISYNDWLTRSPELAQPKKEILFAIDFNKLELIDLDLQYFNDKTFNKYDKYYYGLTNGPDLKYKRWFENEPIIYSYVSIFSKPRVVYSGILGLNSDK